MQKTIIPNPVEALDVSSAPDWVATDLLKSNQFY